METRPFFVLSVKNLLILKLKFNLESPALHRRRGAPRLVLLLLAGAAQRRQIVVEEESSSDCCCRCRFIRRSRRFRLFHCSRCSRCTRCSRCCFRCRRCCFSCSRCSRLVRRDVSVRSMSSPVPLSLLSTSPSSDQNPLARLAPLTLDPREPLESERLPRSR